MAVRLREADNIAAMAELQQQISELEIQVKSQQKHFAMFSCQFTLLPLHRALKSSLNSFAKPHLTTNETALQHTVSLICITEDDGFVGQCVFQLASCTQ